MSIVEILPYIVAAAGLTTITTALLKVGANLARQWRTRTVARQAAVALEAPANVSRAVDVPAKAGDERDGSQEIRFCFAADGVRIAYALTGQGPPLVKAANWLSHLEYDWRSPVWRHWLQGLSRDNTLVRYDERGCGLSDWDVEDWSFEAWVRDLESVVEAAKLQRFPLLGISQGGAVAVDYAVRHPERITKLILYGSYPKGWEKRGGQEVEERRALVTLTKIGWGRDNPAYRQVFATSFIPGASPEQVRWFNDLCRLSASGENAARIMETFGGIDIEDLLPQIRVPTLVLHSRRDERSPFEWGRRMAAGIPGARFVQLESANHILLADEPAWQVFLSEVRSFLKE